MTKYYSVAMEVTWKDEDGNFNKTITLLIEAFNENTAIAIAAQRVCKKLPSVEFVNVRVKLG